jgi:hypothetical protein
MTDYGYKKQCVFCGEIFVSQHRTKKTCSVSCRKRHEASLLRARDQRRRNKSITGDLDANTEMMSTEKRETPA